MRLGCHLEMNTKPTRCRTKTGESPCLYEHCSTAVRGRGRPRRLLPLGSEKAGSSSVVESWQPQLAKVRRARIDCPLGIGSVAPHRPAGSLSALSPAARRRGSG